MAEALPAGPSCAAERKQLCLIPILLRSSGEEAAAWQGAGHVQRARGQALRELPPLHTGEPRSILGWILPKTSPPVYPAPSVPGEQQSRSQALARRAGRNPELC